MARIRVAFLVIATIVLQFSKITNAQGVSVPSKCAGDTICFEKHSDYPQNEIDEHVQNNPIRANVNDYYDEEINKGFRETDDEINCSEVVTMERPFSIKGERNNWYSVVQSKFLTQKIKYVRCKNETSQCMKGMLLQPNLKANCETQKGRINIYAYDEVAKKIKLIPVQVNTCCKCTIRDTTKD